MSSLWSKKYKPVRSLILNLFFLVRFLKYNIKKVSGYFKKKKKIEHTLITRKFSRIFQ